MTIDTTLIQKDNILEEMIRRLVEGMRPQRIYLFGSRARGEATEDSDYDLLVVVGDSNEPRHQRNLKALRLLRGFSIPKDVMVYTNEEYAVECSLIGTLPEIVEDEGIALYVQE